MSQVEEMFKSLGKNLLLSDDARFALKDVVKSENPILQLAKLSQMLKAGQKAEDAEILARAARQIAYDDFSIKVLTEWVDRIEAPVWHFDIIDDAIRLQAYAEALRRYVKPDMIVFEIGTGTGILSMLAVQAGARHVYTCEIQPDVAEIARQIISKNGYQDRITVINKNALNLEMGQDIPERADLFVAEIVDDTLLGERVLPLTEYARHQILKPKAILLPHTVSARGCLIKKHGLRQNYRAKTVMGFDLSPFNRFTPTELSLGRAGAEIEALSDDIELIKFDLNHDAPREATSSFRALANHDGNAEALMRWLHLDFGDGLVFENRLPQKSCWWPHIHIFPKEVPVKKGDEISFELYHNQDRLFLWPMT
ncbi:MAG: hypothetical protein FJZ15_07070 [Candidatus Omnitrophica bacterium]|nr:hypothetical protein [Candidatus Omnitrophota bacterium]